MHTIEWMRERWDWLYEWNMLRKNKMWNNKRNQINFFKKKQKKRRHTSPYLHCAYSCIWKLKVINRKIKKNWYQNWNGFTSFKVSKQNKKIIFVFDELALVYFLCNLSLNWEQNEKLENSHLTCKHIHNTLQMLSF